MMTEEQRKKFKRLQRYDKDKRLGLEYHGEAEPWLVEEHKKMGKNIEGFEHQTDTISKNHVHNKHGNPLKENARRQIAITEDDYKNIPSITGSPDHAMIGAKGKKGEDIVLYAKKLSDGTTVYVEDLLDSRRNKGLRQKTMFKKIDDVDKNEFNKIAAHNGKNDLSKAKIISPIGTGGNPSIAPEKSTAADATSTKPIGQLSNNIPHIYPDVKGLRDKIFHMNYPMSRV